MRDSLDELTGRPGGCAEAVMMQSRPAWTPFLMFALFLPFLALGHWLGLPAFLAGGLSGLVGAIPTVLITRYWILGRTASGVVLARSTKSRAKAIEVAKYLPYPVPATLQPGWIQKQVSLDGEIYFIARQFEERFRSIVGSTSAVEAAHSPNDARDIPD